MLEAVIPYLQLRRPPPPRHRTAFLTHAKARAPRTQALKHSACATAVPERSGCVSLRASGSVFAQPIEHVLALWAYGDWQQVARTQRGPVFSFRCGRPGLFALWSARDRLLVRAFPLETP